MTVSSSFPFSQAFPCVLEYFASMIEVSKLAHHAETSSIAFFLSLSLFLLGMVGVSISTKVCHRHWAPCLWESETMLGVTRKLCVPGNPSISSVPVPLLFWNPPQDSFGGFQASLLGLDYSLLLLGSSIIKMEK